MGVQELTEVTQALDILVSYKRDKSLDVHDSQLEPQDRATHTNLVDDDRKLFVNCVIGLRLVEERENIFG
jgi:hypothetical protein